MEKRQQFLETLGRQNGPDQSVSISRRKSSYNSKWSFQFAQRSEWNRISGGASFLKWSHFLGPWCMLISFLLEHRISLRSESVAVCDCFWARTKVPERGYHNHSVRKSSLCISQKQHQIRRAPLSLKMLAGHSANCSMWTAWSEGDAGFPVQVRQQDTSVSSSASVCHLVRGAHSVVSGQRPRAYPLLYRFGKPRSAQTPSLPGRFEEQAEGRGTDSNIWGHHSLNSEQRQSLAWPPFELV